MATYKITFEFDIDVKGLAKAVILDERTLPIKTKIFDAVMEKVVIPEGVVVDQRVHMGRVSDLLGYVAAADDHAAVGGDAQIRYEQ